MCRAGSKTWYSYYCLAYVLCLCIVGVGEVQRCIYSQLVMLINIMRVFVHKHEHLDNLSGTRQAN
ncbi:hypothetical protein M434DRAFT_328657 [Hypoxylon sp. CO27-5]|nr:hypothetical protein M434DRAFT_328657 [Hypoxylon sp. CO27-5]